MSKSAWRAQQLKISEYYLLNLAQYVKRMLRSGKYVVAYLLLALLICFVFGLAIYNERLCPSLRCC